MTGNDDFCMFVCTLIKLLNIRLLPEAPPLIGRVWTCDPVGNNSYLTYWNRGGDASPRLVACSGARSPYLVYRLLLSAVGLFPR